VSKTRSDARSPKNWLLPIGGDWICCKKNAADGMPRYARERTDRASNVNGHARKTQRKAGATKSEAK
jgi:hypothetical protein